MSAPKIIELDGPAENPADAEPVTGDPSSPRPDGHAMQIAARITARPPSRIGRFFRRALGTLLGFVISVAAWRFIEGLFAANPILGWIGAVLLVIFVIAALLLAMREIAAFARLTRLDRLHQEVARCDGDLSRAQKTVAKLDTLYAARREMRWPRERLAGQAKDELDARTLLQIAERELMSPLDGAARAEIEAASRSVAAATALVPLALADVATALFMNLRMIRRIAAIYGGRTGSLGSLRLARGVMAHLVATGAVAAGDDLVETVAGGHLAARLSRRFGEGIVNGALTARVGIAAMEVCRPMPFSALPKPRVTRLIGRSLSGLFNRGSRDSGNPGA